MGKVALNRAGETVGFQRGQSEGLKKVELSPAVPAIVVLLESESDRAAFRAAFRDTPGASDPSIGQDLDLYEFPLDQLADVRAVWAAGFRWEAEAMTAFIERLLREIGANAR